jgi:acyl dehydratase
MDAFSTPHPRGGLYFEDFAPRQVFRHRLTRTVTQMDNMLFSNMTLNPQPLHIDAHFCATETEWGRPLMNSLFTLGLMIGISVNDTTVGTTIANLGMTDVRFPNPLFEGDTVNATTEVLSTRASQSRANAGLVEFHHRAFKQDGALVAECRRTAFMRRRPPATTSV